MYLFGGSMNEPLAIKLSPKSIKDIIGQEHLVGKDKILYNIKDYFGLVNI